MLNGWCPAKWHCLYQEDESSTFCSRLLQSEHPSSIRFLVGVLLAQMSAALVVVKLHNALFL